MIPELIILHMNPPPPPTHTHTHKLCGGKWDWRAVISEKAFRRHTQTSFLLFITRLIFNLISCTWAMGKPLFIRICIQHSVCLLQVSYILNEPIKRDFKFWIVVKIYCFLQKHDINQHFIDVHKIGKNETWPRRGSCEWWSLCDAGEHNGMLCYLQYTYRKAWKISSQLMWATVEVKWK
jgi:hypothetical protein